MRARIWWVVVLTTPQVAAVLVNGRTRVPTVRLPSLPYGLRAARIVMALHTTKSPSGRLRSAPPREPALVPLSSAGRPLGSSTLKHAITPAVGYTRSAACALRAAGIPGLKAEWSHVVPSIRPLTGPLVGHTFFSCIDTEFYMSGWPVDAAVLVDAVHPSEPPGRIPGLTPVPGASAFLNGPGDFKGELTATRRGNAWLVVAGGSSLSQRISLLRHLTATVKV